MSRCTSVCPSLTIQRNSFSTPGMNSGSPPASLSTPTCGIQRVTDWKASSTSNQSVTVLGVSPISSASSGCCSSSSATELDTSLKHMRHFRLHSLPGRRSNHSGACVSLPVWVLSSKLGYLLA